MTADPDSNVPQSNKQPALPPQKLRAPLMRLPALIAISFYLLLLSGISVVDVVTGHYTPVYLIFSVFFIAGALGLLLLLRWAWALSLAALALLSAMFLFQFFTQHILMFLMQGLLNLLFFFYLVRTEVREKLK